MFLVAGDLRLRKACFKQVELFEQLFPQGAEFNRENWDKAAAAGLLVRWMHGFLPFDSAAYRQYGVVIREARDALYEACSADRHVHEEECMQAYRTHPGTFTDYGMQFGPEWDKAVAVYQDEVAKSAQKFDAAAQPFVDVYHNTCNEVAFRLLQAHFGEGAR